MKQFNMNSVVRVKITKIGYKYLAEEYNKFVAEFPTSSLRKRSSKYYERQAYTDGYTHMQMHEFMGNFGGVSGMSAHKYFNFDILIREEDLQEFNPLP